MLKGIPNFLSAELLTNLMEMGRGDDIFIDDGNFSAASHAKRLARCDGHGTALVLDAILQLFPLDIFVKEPVALMSVVPGDNYNPDIWPAYKTIIQQYDLMSADFNLMKRYSVYGRAKKAYAVVAPGETPVTPA